MSRIAALTKLAALHQIYNKCQEDRYNSPKLELVHGYKHRLELGLFKNVRSMGTKDSPELGLVKT